MDQRALSAEVVIGPLTLPESILRPSAGEPHSMGTGTGGWRHGRTNEISGLEVGMSTVLEFRNTARPGRRRDGDAACEIVIFPGVRIEREPPATLDLAHRLRASLAMEDGGGDDRPRQAQ
jgi:hypothetical protein